MSERTDSMPPKLPETPASRVERELRVLTAAMEPGTALPTVRELARRFDTSPATVGKAIQRLAREGVVNTVRGWGVFVASPR